LLGSTTTVKKASQERRVFHASRNIKHMVLLSTKPGWKLSEDRRTITFSDGFEAGSFKLWGTRDLHFYQLKQIKRVRVVRRADGYYAQFCLDVERVEKARTNG
jgi:transposase